jgi:hypothetical protein
MVEVLPLIFCLVHRTRGCSSGPRDSFFCSSQAWSTVYHQKKVILCVYGAWRLPRVCFIWNQTPASADTHFERWLRRWISFCDDLVSILKYARAFHLYLFHPRWNPLVSESRVVWPTRNGSLSGLGSLYAPARNLRCLSELTIEF